MGFPVFATGISVMTTNVWGVSGEYDIPIQCGGIPVNPGDLILGNADGVISINNPNYMELLEQAEAAEAREVVMRERFAKGEFLLTDVDPLLAADVPGYIKQYREKGRR
jgi:regulator of RNase E activity RraA